MHSKDVEIAVTLLFRHQYHLLCVFMFCLHKTNIDRWLKAKDSLLMSVQKHRDLSLLSSVIKCSIKADLSSCYQDFPGLTDLVNSSR